MKQMDKIAKQYEQFKIVKLNIQIQSKSSQKVLDSLSSVQFEKEFSYQSDLKEKARIYNYLDFQVHTIKEESNGLEKRLKDIAKIVSGVKEIIEEVDFKNQELSGILKFFKKTFLNAQVKILKLNRSLNVNNEDDLILKFKDESLKYNTFFDNVHLLIKCL